MARAQYLTNLRAIGCSSAAAADKDGFRVSASLPLSELSAQSQAQSLSQPGRLGAGARRTALPGQAVAAFKFVGAAVSNSSPARAASQQDSQADRHPAAGRERSAWHSSAGLAQ
jgi:hypothetical protein